MPLVLHAFDQLHRKQTNGTFRSAVHLQISLPIPFDSVLGDLRLENRLLRDTAIRDVDLVHMGVRGPPGLAHDRATSQDSPGVNSSASQPSRSRWRPQYRPASAKADTISPRWSRRTPETSSLPRVLSARGRARSSNVRPSRLASTTSWGPSPVKRPHRRVNSGPKPFMAAYSRAQMMAVES